MKSLSGHRIEGENLVRLVYIDEAGISNPQHEPFLVVAGCIVNADAILNGVNNHLDRLMHRHIPEEHHDNFVFSAKHVLNGDNKVIKRNDPEWPIERRLEIFSDILDIPRKFNIPICFGWIERETFPKTFDLPDGWKLSEITVAAHAAAFMSCSLMIDRWMRNETENENCILVVENNDQAKRAITETQREYQDKKILPLLTKSETDFFPLRKIKEDPLFQEKKQSNPMILADFCAYSFKRHLQGDKHIAQFYNQIMDKVVTFSDDLKTLV